jgi:amino acid transporter
MAQASFAGSLKRLLIGPPIPSYAAEHERLTPVTGLGVFCSDGLSSVAYATEEVLRALLVAGASALWLATPVSLAIAVLMLVVALSYRQTIQAYPGGGGAYLVAHDTLGATAGLVAAAALMMDYVLTVAVSVAAAVAALTSALPGSSGHRVVIGLALLGLLAVGNLRGVRDSGLIVSVPTYAFLVSVLGLLAVGAVKAFAGAAAPALPSVAPAAPLSAVTIAVVLRAFANGCTAATGVEAVSNGVPAFRPPQARNAAATLLWATGLAMVLFLGVTLLAHAYRIVPAEDETVISQLARGILGGRGPAYYAVQAATLALLVVAANSAYADFPRLSSILARHRYMPRQFMNQGDRLAFSNGIAALSLIAGMLLVVFGGDTHALIPLYMVGAFISFSLSQTGMAVKRWREGGKGALVGAAVSGLGAALTTVVLGVVAFAKLAEGAWIVLALIPLVVVAFRTMRGHYRMVAAQLSCREWAPPPRRGHVVILAISGVHRAVLAALEYARSLGTEVRAVYVEIEPEATARIREDWALRGQGLELVVLPSPYRSLLEPLIAYVQALARERGEDYVTVVLPEFVPARWWHHVLHNQRAWLIKAALLFQPRVIVTSVPYQLRR